MNRWLEIWLLYSAICSAGGWILSAHFFLIQQDADTRNGASPVQQPATSRR